MSGNPRQRTRLISLEPDLIDEYGHYLSFNERLAEACAAAGIEFIVLAGKQCDPQILQDHPFIRPTFKLRSWDAGVVPSSPLAKWQFGLELSAALSEVTLKAGAGKTVLFMYTASLGHAQMVEKLLRWRGLTDVTAVMQYFRIHFENPLRARFVRKWAPFLQRITAGNRVRLVLPTPQSAQRFEEAFGFQPSLVPHPSPAFSDARARHLSAAAVAERSSSTRIVFPGGVRVEKGFAMAVDAAVHLAEQPGIECVVRAIHRDGVSETLETSLAKLRASRCMIADQTLTPAEFDSFIASADVLVLPYAASHFGERTSGLLVDAMLLGVPVVAGRGTWLGDLIDQEGCGVSVPLTRSSSLIEGINQVLGNLESYRAQTAAARIRYLENHSWERLLDDLVSSSR